jgi:uncharacterized phage infection (PIP) family protein YhgE
MGMAREEAGKLSSQIVELSADLGSFNNMPTARVMQDIQSALAGQYEPLRKYGVMLSATKIQQEALNAGLADTKDELTESDKAITAYRLLLEGSSDAIGDVARSQGSYAYEVRRLTANIDDLKTEIGKELLPVFSDMLEDTNQWISDNDELLKQRIPEYVESIAEGIGSMADTVGDFVNSKEYKMMTEYWELLAGAAVGFRYGGGVGALIGAGAGGYWSAYKDIKEYIGHGGKVSEEARELEKLVKEYESLNKRILEFSRAQAEGTKLTSAQQEALEKIISQRDEVSEAIDRQRKALKQATTQAKETGEQTKKTAEQTVPQLDAVHVAAEAISGAFYSWDANLENIPPHISKISEKTKALQRTAESIFEATRTPVENLYTDLERLNELYAQGMVTQETYYRAITMYGEKYTAQWERTADDVVDANQDAADETDEIWNNFVENTQGILADWIYEWDLSFDSILDMFWRMISQMAAVDLTRVVFGSGATAGAGLLTGPGGGLLGNISGGGGGGYGFPSLGGSRGPLAGVMSYTLPGTGTAAVEAGTGAVANVGGMQLGTALGYGAL